jgi:hypothetical protein
MFLTRLICSKSTSCESFDVHSPGAIRLYRSIETTFFLHNSEAHNVCYTRKASAHDGQSPFDTGIHDASLHT